MYDNVVPTSLKFLFWVITLSSEYQTIFRKGLLMNRIISSHLILQNVFPRLMTHCWKVLCYLHRDDELFWLQLWYHHISLTNQSRYIVLVNAIDNKSKRTMFKTNNWSMTCARGLLYRIVIQLIVKLGNTIPKFRNMNKLKIDISIQNKHDL